MTVLVDLQEQTESNLTPENFLVCTETVKSTSVQRGWYVYQAHTLEAAVTQAKNDGLNPVYVVPMSVVSEVQKEKTLLEKVFKRIRK